MYRWHRDVPLMRSRARRARRDHLYDFRPWCDCRRCAAAVEIGWWRSRKPRDCGRPRCGVCHFGKYDRKRRAGRLREALRYEDAACDAGSVRVA